MSMDLSQKNIGIAITGSYCTYKKVFAELEKLASTGANLYPIFSDHASTTDSRFGKCADFLEQAEKITGKKPITTIPDAEQAARAAVGLLLNPSHKTIVIQNKLKKGGRFV